MVQNPESFDIKEWTYYPLTTVAKMPVDCKGASDYKNIGIILVKNESNAKHQFKRSKHVIPITIHSGIHVGKTNRSYGKRILDKMVNICEYANSYHSSILNTKKLCAAI